MEEEEKADLGNRSGTVGVRNIGKQIIGLEISCHLEGRLYAREERKKKSEKKKKRERKKRVHNNKHAAIIISTIRSCAILEAATGLRQRPYVYNKSPLIPPIPPSLPSSRPFHPLLLGHLVHWTS